MPNIFARLLGSTRGTSPVSTPQDPSTRTGAPRTASGDAAVHTAWVPRDAGFWTERTSGLLDRLRREWVREPEAARWPDVLGLLDLLSAQPDEVIRQLPDAVHEVMAMCDDLSLSRAELADRLSLNPSLVQRVLRQANSALHGGGLAPVLRVDAAIERIGVTGTRAVVLAACVEGMLSKPGPPFDAMHAIAWGHMVDTAPLARLVASEFDADPDVAFAIALLHDVGRLVVFDRVSTLRAARRRPIRLPDAWFALLLDQLHEPMGAVAAHRWGFGDVAADAIGTHHRRERPAGRHPLAETLFLAERAALAKSSGEPFDFDGIWGLGALSGAPLASRGILGRHVRSTLHLARPGVT